MAVKTTFINVSLDSLVLQGELEAIAIERNQVKETTKTQKKLGKSSLAGSIPDLIQMKRKGEEEKVIQTWISKLPLKPFLI